MSCDDPNHPVNRTNATRPAVAVPESHLKTILEGFLQGRVVPFLGAGANCCDRKEGDRWRIGNPSLLPTGNELARYLARDEQEERGLSRVAQYVAYMKGRGSLKQELRTIFDADYPPTAAHRLLAGVPRMLREQGFPRTEDPLLRQLLIVTTNYDDVLERAFDEVAEPYHLMTYCAGSREFCHTAPNGESTRITNARSYRGHEDEIPLVLKIHGAINRAEKSRDSFVVTEDDYIDYLASVNIEELLPPSLIVKLRESFILFLGYALEDWNVRVILKHLWSNPDDRWRSWAIQLDANELDKRIWAKQDVEILETPLNQYVAEIERRLLEHLARAKREEYAHDM